MGRRKKPEEPKQKKGKGKGKGSKTSTVDRIKFIGKCPGMGAKAVDDFWGVWDSFFKL